MNKTLDDFISYLKSVVAHGDLYIWGAQGQHVTDKFIDSREKDPINRTRVRKLWKTRLSQGYTDLRAFDCSGLGMSWLQNIAHIVSYDMNANNLKNKCILIPKEELQKGDFVFKCRNGVAKHIGYVIDNNHTVIEARGRDWGVISDKLENNNWNAYGHPMYFIDEIIPFEFTRNLQVGMSGSDVKCLQILLVKHGISCNTDGEFGLKTESAVKIAQRQCNLTETGVVESSLIICLGGKWTNIEKPSIPDGSSKYEWVLSRILYYKKPMLTGKDVKMCQIMLNKYTSAHCTEDGKFGKKTKLAVQSFQQLCGLPVTGIVDKFTCIKLHGHWHANWMIHRILQRKYPMMHGDDVELIQIALLELGYNVGNTGVDGKFGKSTEHAVKQFQKNHNLVVDGKVGVNTCKAMGGTWAK